MPYIIAALGLMAAVYFFVIRTRNAADMATDLLDVANDVRAAARRFGFTRRANIHPVEAIDDPRTAAMTVAVAYAELDDYPTEDTRSRLARALASAFGMTLRDAEELMVLGRWLMTECQGPQPAVSRAARKLYKLSGGEDFAALMDVIKAVSPETGLSERQTDALDDLKRAFHIR